MGWQIGKYPYLLKSAIDLIVTDEKKNEKKNVSLQRNLHDRFYDQKNHIWHFQRYGSPYD